MGVPTHYQNNGSCLYLLTPVFSPPSADCVHRWLFHDERGMSRENFSAASVEPSSLKGSSSSLVGSQGSLADACNKPLPESGSISNVKPILDQLNQQNHGNLNAEMNRLCERVKETLLQSEVNIVKVKECTNSSQDISQISGPDGKSKPTPLSQIGFRDPASVGGGQQLTLLSIEVLAESRGDLRPNPRFDAINVIALAIQNDDDSVPVVYVLLRSSAGSCQRNLDGISGCNMLVYSEEKHLINHFMKTICSFDPDIIMGWDIQGGSLGFLAERASYLGIGLLNNISRTPSETKIAARDSEIPEKEISDNMLPESVIADSVLLEDAIIEDEWGRTHAHVGGRVVLNIWRLMRGEIKLNMYTVEAVAEAVLRRKIPLIHYKVLTKWFLSGPGRARYRCIEYVMERAKLNLEIMNQIDMINRTSELARVLGIEFFSVLSRGSQYRVESMFLRLAHTQNYLPIYPGKQQDFVFAKEVRLGTYSTRASSSLPPAAIVATKAMRADPRAEPRYAERIPYVVIHGEPGARLVDMVVDLLDLLAIDSPFRLNDLYYIIKQIIPALQQVFGLIGSDLNQWFLEMPHPVRETFGKRHYHAPNPHRTRIDYYYLSEHCILCGELVRASAHLCNLCSKKGTAVVTAVTVRTSKLEREMQHLAAICRHCGGGD